MHESDHELAGKTVKLNVKAQCPRGMVLSGKEFRVENWADKLGLTTGSVWFKAPDNWAALHYMNRVIATTDALPFDDEIVYGKIDGLGHIVHVSELGELVS